jgi:phenylalanyl-tRNA synthetase beta chain
MKISLRWLNEFVDVNEYFERPDQLANLLTGAGLEVEEIHNLAQQYKFVQIGLILEKDKHPDADKLSVCKVTTGDGVVHQIVCGAKNHKTHDRVIVALPGAILPGNFAIKNSVIRGVSSGGMLCSYKELGMAEVSDGIAILPETAEIGQSFAEYAGMSDVTFELKVTPNRADCLSHLGLAREVACLLNRPFKRTDLKEFVMVGAAGADFNIEVLDPEMCPRYTGRIIRGIKVGASPSWLKKRLETVGLNSINNVVDVTNYVMMEWGQPLHAFDLRQIQGGKLRIGKSQPQEKFITLDGTELKLRGDELMIQDANRSLCMGGVIGGKNSGVQDDTQDIFLESAYFAPQFVRRGARGHGLNTDSGYRFSRGVDPTHTVDALNRATSLLLEVAGGQVGSAIFEIKSKPAPRPMINIHPNMVSDRLGYSVDIAKFESWMLRLGCQLEKKGEAYQIQPPAWRFDLEIDMDLVEEYARLNGYEHIPETLPPLGRPPTGHDIPYRFQNYLIELMTGLGYSQALNFAFVGTQKQSQLIGDHDLVTKCGLHMAQQPVRLVNPLNEQIDVMRASLSMGLVDNLHHNFHHGVETGRLFELGSVFDLASGSYQERLRWAGLAWGWPDNLWSKANSSPVVMDLKRAVEEVLNVLGFRSWVWLKPVDVGGVPHFLHPGQAVILQLEGKKIGYLGTLHPSLREDLKVRTDVAIFEFEAETLIKGLGRSQIVKAISKFQAVDRDLALVMPRSLAAGEVQFEIQKLGGVNLQSVSVFDVYEGDNLAEGQKSVAYRLRFQNLESTLTDAQVQESIDTILANVKKRWEIQVR